MKGKVSPWIILLGCGLIIGGMMWLATMTHEYKFSNSGGMSAILTGSVSIVDTSQANATTTVTLNNGDNIIITEQDITIQADNISCDLPLNHEPSVCRGQHYMIVITSPPQSTGSSG